MKAAEILGFQYNMNYIYINSFAEFYIGCHINNNYIENSFRFF